MISFVCVCPCGGRYDIIHTSRATSTNIFVRYLPLSKRKGVEEAAENIESADFSETGYSYTLSLISGKYKPVILYCLMEYEPVRFNQMQRYLQDVADKTLSQNLKELEADGLINRKMYPQVPPKVEYTLTFASDRITSGSSMLLGICAAAAAVILAAAAGFFAAYRKKKRQQ